MSTLLYIIQCVKSKYHEKSFKQIFVVHMKFKKFQIIDNKIYITTSVMVIKLIIIIINKLLINYTQI